jgi:hypothetical protein
MARQLAYAPSTGFPSYAPVDEVRQELGGVLPDGFMLRRPLIARIWFEHGEYIADVDELNLRGFGDTPTDAIDYLRHQVVSQYRRLQNLGDRLAPPLRRLAETFQQVVKPPDA